MSCHDHKGTPPCLLPLITRRRFLKQTAATAAVAAALPACEFAESYVEGEVLTFNLDDAQFAALQTVGQTVSYPDKELVADGFNVILVRLDEETIIALDRVCPHQGWNMDPDYESPLPNGWDQENKVLQCGLHASQFSPSGELVFGPASDIKSYPVTFDPASGEVTCTLS